MRRAFKFRLFTNTNQERELKVMLETHRRLYNACLSQRKITYETEKRSIRYVEQSAWFTIQRKTNPFFGRLNCSSGQATLRRLDKAFIAFYRRCKTGEKPGYPRFKSADKFDSIEFPAYGDGIRLNNNKLRVQHVGLIRCKVHRQVEGVVKTATIKQESGKWYVILSCDLGETAVPKSTKPPVGIDLGLESFLTTSNGNKVPNPHYFKKELPELRRRQRAVSRKHKGSKNRRKAIHRVQILHTRIRNLRNEHHHQTALKLVRSYGLIGVECLNITKMLKSHTFSRSISDAGWASFVNILRCKAERAGVEIVAVSPVDTSQECSGCGVIVPKKLCERRHLCPTCGLDLHRDENAARNILARALLARMGPVGVNGESSVAQEAVCFS